MAQEERAALLEQVGGQPAALVWPCPLPLHCRCPNAGLAGSFDWLIPGTHLPACPARRLSRPGVTRHAGWLPVECSVILPRCSQTAAAGTGA